MTPETTGEIIRRVRIQRGMTQQELAGRTGYTGRSAITRIENGSNGVPLRKLPIFAKALGVTDAYLLNSLENLFYVLGYEITKTEESVSLSDDGKTATYKSAEWEQMRMDYSVERVYSDLSLHPVALSKRQEMQNTIYKLIDSLPESKLPILEAFLEGLKNK